MHDSVSTEYHSSRKLIEGTWQEKGPLIDTFLG